MPESNNKRLKTKSEFQVIQKKISKIEYYLSRIEQDMKQIAKQAEQVKINKTKQQKRLQDRLDSIRRYSQQQLRKISIQINHNIAIHKDNCCKISIRLSQLQQQQMYNREIINQLKQKLTTIEIQLGQ